MVNKSKYNYKETSLLPRLAPILCLLCMWRNWLTILHCFWFTTDNRINIKWWNSPGWGHRKGFRRGFQDLTKSLFYLFPYKSWLGLCCDKPVLTKLLPLSRYWTLFISKQFFNSRFNYYLLYTYMKKRRTTLILSLAESIMSHIM